MRAVVELEGSASLAFCDEPTIRVLTTFLDGGDINSLDQPIAIASVAESRLIELGILGLTIVGDEGQELCNMTGFGYGKRLNRAPVPSSLQVHPYTYLRRDGADIVLLNPLSTFRVTVRTGAVLSLLLFGESVGTGETINDLIRRVFWSSGLATAVSELCEIQFWQFEDLLFHSISRGRSDYRPRGATYPFVGRYDEPRQIIAREREAVALTPLRRELLADVSFRDILENRRSVRQAESAATAADISAVLLVATGNVVNETTRHLPHPTKPYPSAGGIHELTYYVVAERLVGVERGLYRFDPAQRDLEPVPADIADIGRILDEAAESWGREHGRPAAVVILAAAVPLVTWKYESVGYRMVLLNAGFAMQTICQVATALGIATCPLGTGDSEVFSKMIRTTEWSETSVAEIAIAGSLRRAPEGHGKLIHDLGVG